MEEKFPGVLQFPFALQIEGNYRRDLHIQPLPPFACLTAQHRQGGRGFPEVPFAIPERRK